MPKVSINIIKDWFKNQMKPPQEQFWAWLDSFWHKDEPIPQSAVENLVTTLQKKADLVNGVVPEDQLPFSVVTSEVIALGVPSVAGNKVNLSVHSSGANKVRVKGRLITRSFPNQWTFTPVSNNGIKVIRGYAVKTEDDFFISEGAELPNYTAPEIPVDALEIFRIQVNSAGAIVEPPKPVGLKYNEEDGWRNIRLSELVTILPYSFDLRSSYWLESVIGNPVIGGIQNGLIDRNASPSWDGKEFWIYNNTGTDLKLDSSGVEGVDVFLFGGNNIPLTLKAKQSCKIKLHENVLEIIGVMSSGSALPVAGSNGLVLESDATQPGGVKWGTKIKGVADKMLHYWDATGSWVSSGVEFAGNAILKLKIISFGGYTIAQKTAIASPTEGMLIYQNEAPKGFQKYENGAWTAVGSNLSNADLSNVSARIFTQGNTFTWNTAGFFYYLKGLLDKTGNAAYTKVVVVHPTTGEMVTKDAADPAIATLAIQNANSTQKTAMRTALLGTATPANPTLQDVAPKFVTRGIVYIDLLGLNLLLLAPVFIWIEKLDGTKIYATNFYNISNSAVTTQWDLPSDLPLGDYIIQIQNGVTTQGLSTAKFTLVNSVTDLVFLNSSWKRKLRLLAGGTEATSNANNASSDNYIRIDNTAVNGYDGTSDSIPAVIYKSENVFPGNKDFDIEITVNLLTSSGATGSDFTPYIGLTETNHSDFNNILLLTYNSNIYESILTARTTLTGGGIAMNGIVFKIYIAKVGNKVNWRLSNNNNSGFVYKQDTIDTTKNYALFFRHSYHNNNWFSRLEHFITSARIMN